MPVTPTTKAAENAHLLHHREEHAYTSKTVMLTYLRLYSMQGVE